MSKLIFNPARSTVPFFLSDKFASFIVGPYGPVSGDTEFLTPHGWKRIDAYEQGDCVAQWAPGGSLTFARPLDYIVTPADSLIEFTSGKLRMCLSDQHRVPYYDYKGAFKETTAAEAAAHPSIRVIPSTFTVQTEGMDFSEADIRLMVAVHADGHFPKPDSFRCHVILRKERKKERLRNLLRAANTQWIEKEYSARPAETRFIFAAPRIGKRFTGYWWKANATQLAAILDECVHWDGSTKNEELLYFSAHEEDAAFIQYAAHACGGGASISRYEYTKTHQAKWNASYRVFIAKAGSPKAKRQLSTHSTVTTRVPALGSRQYCFSTSTTYFLARYRGSLFVTGNSTKTTVGIMKIAREASMVARCSDGIRRSRCAVVRNTRQMLWDTTIPDFLKWFPDGQAGVLMKTDSKFLLKFGDVECEVLFRGLDEANDVRRLLSLQLTFGMMDEFREIHPDIYEALAGRVGRYPDKVLVPARPEWGVDEKGNPIGGCVRDDGSAAKRIWGMSNPPDMDTFWEQLLTDPPSNAHVTLQPSGVSAEADWVHLLDSGYYENLMELHAKDPDWVDVYVHSKFGKSLAGRPVFRSFDPTYHVAKETLRPIVSENYPLIIGMDFGLTPACTINQQDARGRFLTLAECVSEGMGVLRFSREVLKPLLTNRFPGHPVVIIGDPAGAQRAQTDERSVFDILRNEKFEVHPARTNTISARIAAVEELLGGQVDTGPRHLIDPSCKKIITALRGGYRYKMKTSGETEDKPDKNYYSHIADAHQYACLHVNGVFGGASLRGKTREVERASMLGWT